MKLEFPRGEKCFCSLTLNMAALTSRANQQYCNNQMKVTETEICGGTRLFKLQAGSELSTIDDDLI